MRVVRHHHTWIFSRNAEKPPAGARRSAESAANTAIAIGTPFACQIWHGGDLCISNYSRPPVLRA